MSASDIGKRMRHHLEQASLYAGESSHGFRRGQMQALSAAGMPSADIVTGMLRVPSTLLQCLPSSAHMCLA